MLYVPRSPLLACLIADKEKSLISFFFFFGPCFSSWGEERCLLEIQVKKVGSEEDVTWPKEAVACVIVLEDLLVECCGGECWRHGFM